MPTADHNAVLLPAADLTSLDRHLANEWDKALAGDANAQAKWKSETGGEWLWKSDAVRVTSSGTEWSDLSWQDFDGAALSALRNFVVEVTVSGKAEAAGLSFGPYKDFLAKLDPRMDQQRLQLEIDVNAKCWAFRVDGQLQHRTWWDSSVHTTDDLLTGILTFKARRAEEIHFRDFAIRTFESSCQLSVIITCYRFLQRLRVTLRNWCHQTIPYGSYEILVVNPNSPDGTHEHLAAVAMSYPHVRVRELAVEVKPVTNKAAMINRAVQASRGEWIWLADSDCLFAPTAAEMILAQIKGRTSRLFYGRRIYLTTSQTSELLAGRSDGLRDFDALCHNLAPRALDNEPWGYTQIVHRTTLERIPYHEQVDHFAHSDSLFIQDCRRRKIIPEQIEGLFCLHLDHPFAWYGTNSFL